MAPQGYNTRSDCGLILVGLGANLPSSWGPPRRTLEAALDRLEASGVSIVRRSRFYATRPVPVSDQPWFVNAVAAVESGLGPVALLALLHRIEAEFGRRRSVVNAARTLDLDLLAHGRMVRTEERPLLPHPRMGERAFVLYPLRDVAPAWVHPASGEGLEAMIARLPADQMAEPQD